MKKKVSSPASKDQLQLRRSHPVLIWLQPQITEFLSAQQNTNGPLCYGALVKVGQWSDLSEHVTGGTLVLGSLWGGTFTELSKIRNLLLKLSSNVIRGGQGGFQLVSVTMQTVVMVTRKDSHLVGLSALDLPQRVQIVLFLHQNLINSDLSIKPRL